MLLGIKDNKTVFTRYAMVGLIATALVYMVYLLNSTWSPDMRLWKAFGGGAFLLLWFTVFIGPAAKVWPWLSRLVTFRRETGVYFALVALVHGYLVLDGWVNWGLRELVGYQFFGDVNMWLRAEPGFGLANLMGLLALLFAVILAATSFDRVVSFLGVSSWKWLHNFAYVIFYIIALHVIYFAFIHYTPSPQRLMLGLPTNYPNNPLAYYYLIGFIIVFMVQFMAFIKTVKAQRKKDWY